MILKCNFFHILKSTFRNQYVKGVLHIIICIEYEKRLNEYYNL